MIVSAVAAIILSVNTYASTPNDSIVYSAAIFTNASTGRLAPYMIGSWNSDRSTMKNAATLDLSAYKSMSTDTRLDWGAGAEVLTGYQHSAVYETFESSSARWGTTIMRPAPVSLRQAYVEAHYRSIYILGGMKYAESKIVDNRLSSGDLILSNNARPIPGVTVGFTDFRDIPFTNGWLQVDGRIMYGRFTDNKFRRKQYNYFNDLIATDLFYTYKYCYFRTDPLRRLSVIFGMQSAGQFGGTTIQYRHGHVFKTEHRGFRFVDVAKMFFPTRDNGNGFYEGNSVGSWSLRANYRFASENTLSAYWENLFEDGSGIACRNGLDGLYGLQFTMHRKGWFDSAVIEYLDFRNQSGPLHFAPGDHPGSTITTEATGGDNYYNNDTYGAYANYGMAIGSPMVMSPVYNANGFPEFIYNRMRGTHIAVAGSPSSDISYRLMGSWQKGYAMGRVPLPHAKSDVSAMAEIGWHADRLIKGLDVNCRVAFDKGELRGDNFGAALTIRYTGNFEFRNPLL